MGLEAWAKRSSSGRVRPVDAEAAEVVAAVDEELFDLAIELVPLRKLIESRCWSFSSQVSSRP